MQVESTQGTSFGGANVNDGEGTRYNEILKEKMKVSIFNVPPEFANAGASRQ